MSKLVETYRGLVYPWHCDHIGHMNVMWYTGKFDEATWHLFATIGLTRTFLRERNRGLAAVQQNTTYKRELFAGDLVEIRSGIIEVREKVIRYYHEMRNVESNEVSATSLLTGVYLNKETRKSSPFPEEILERGRSAVVEIAR